jgi:hypothetical protein
LPHQVRRAAIDGGWRQRWTDYRFLTSPEAREIIEQQGIAVIDYRPIQQAWCQPMHLGKRLP